MEQNVGGTDRLVRLVAGPLLLLIGLAGYAGLIGLAVGPLSQALAAVLVALVGLILTVTGLTQFCLLHTVLGINTCRT